MASTITAPVTGRIPFRHVDALRRVADRDGSTVSGMIARLVAENIGRFDRKAISDRKASPDRAT
jgi:hypothetical protein